jgi:organic radical activating enzyme
MVILTGGEPLAQRETLALIEALRRDGRRVHIESNGTIYTELPADVWLCVSPKERVDPRMARRANEVKLIVDERVPEEWLELFSDKPLLLLQPEGNKPKNVTLALDYAKAHPDRFRLSLQTHKLIGVP